MARTSSFEQLYRRAMSASAKGKGSFASWIARHKHLSPQALHDALVMEDIDQLDRWAFGFASGDTLDVPVKDIEIVFPGDLENPVYAAGRASSPTAWAKTVSFEEPIKIKLKGGRLTLQDGHHRYHAATILGKKTLPAEVDIDDNAVTKLLGRVPAKVH